MEPRRILVLDREYSIYSDPFEKHGEILYSHTFKNEDYWGLISRLYPHLVVFVGGTDVSPNLYGEDREHHTSAPDYNRDTHETHIFNECVKNEVPMVGICRGAQFLCVMNGGKLGQHIAGHEGGSHSLYTKEVNKIGGPRAVWANSLHHQIMRPVGNFELVAWSRKNGRAEQVSQWPEISHDQEPEVVWWPDTQSLGVQYHPEMMGHSSEGWLYFQELLTRYFFNANQEEVA